MKVNKYLGYNRIFMAPVLYYCYIAIAQNQTEIKPIVPNIIYIMWYIITLIQYYKYVDIQICFIVLRDILTFMAVMYCVTSFMHQVISNLFSLKSWMFSCTQMNHIDFSIYEVLHLMLDFD